MSESEIATWFGPPTRVHSHAVTTNSITVRLRAGTKKAASYETAFHDSYK